MINKLKMRIRICNNGIKHDSRGDVRVLAEAIMNLQEKMNEIIEYMNQKETK